MIEIKNIAKSFGEIRAVNEVSFAIPEGCIFGLVGTNGAGKSSLLRMMAGIYRPDKGQTLIDGEDVFENLAVKQNVFYISDDVYFFRNACMDEMCGYFKCIYPAFSEEVYKGLTKAFDLDPKRRIGTFSKGMTRQAMMIFAFASRAKYLLLDETFDGLDPVMRQAIKRLLAAGVSDYQATPVIASHSLRELEDICDRVGLLHKGGMVLDMDMERIEINMHKIQCAFAEEPSKDWFDDIALLSFEKRGRLCTLVAEGEPEAIMSAVNAHAPQFAEMIPLTLEELFVSKMEGIGYEIKDILD